MSHLLRKLATVATLSSVLLLGASAGPSGGSQPILGGHAKVGPTISTPEPSILDVTVHLVELPDGTLVGGGKVTKKSDDGWFQFELTSYVRFADQVLAAGPVTAVNAGPAGTPWSVGDTFFCVVDDNGQGGALDKFLEGRVPAQFGALTAQQIIALLGPPPPPIYRDVLSGNLTVH